jgi:ABC-type Zn2+ transport system substrate-binding protein/surface adhesin
MFGDSHNFEFIGKYPSGITFFELINKVNMKQTPIEKLLATQGKTLTFRSAEESKKFFDDIKEYEKNEIMNAYTIGWADSEKNKSGDFVRFQNALDYYEKTFGKTDGSKIEPTYDPKFSHTKQPPLTDIVKAFKEMNNQPVQSVTSEPKPTTFTIDELLGNLTTELSDLENSDVVIGRIAKMLYEKSRWEKRANMSDDFFGMYKGEEY